MFGAAKYRILFLISSHWDVNYTLADSLLLHIFFDAQLPISSDLTLQCLGQPCFLRDSVYFSCVELSTCSSGSVLGNCRIHENECTIILVLEDFTVSCGGAGAEPYKR